ncbi:M23 family metallopeptidase [Pendulispora rubella]
MASLFGDGMREAFPVEKLTRIVDGLLEAKGRIESSSRVEPPQDENEGFYRFRTERGEWRVELHVDPSGKVSGLKFNEPPAPAPPVVTSTVSLGLPYRGQWLVHWGGDRREVNAHVDNPSQRRAVDLVVVGPDGKTHRTDGRTNKDYHAYGREVLAVADGVVVAAVDGVQENEPGEENPYLVPGNMVILKHTDHLYSLYAHLQPTKLRVKVGARVKKAAVLGLCGNSGNSTEPHLHFQLQDGPRLEDSWGIEAVFDDVTVAHEKKTGRVMHYTFLKGDLVGNPGNAL